MKISKKHISICEVCNGEGYEVIESIEDFDVVAKAYHWCSLCNGQGYLLRHDKKEKLKAMALEIYEGKGD
jgi:DnaJ-class molecular chaperone